MAATPSAAPDLGAKVLEAAWVLVFFLLAASAYAFFQVPYVAMPAEITSSYDERTRLMTWRVSYSCCFPMSSQHSKTDLKKKRPWVQRSRH